jgi:uncharacterized alpha-E superfamily protein
MLSRTAANLYWLGRYMERAENTARMLEVADRVSLLTASDDAEKNEWHSVLMSTGSADAFYERHEEAGREAVIDFLAMDQDNPSSIRSCMATARTNARAVRTSLSADTWEALNGSWLELAGAKRNLLLRGELRPFVDWIKERATLFSGNANSNIMRTEGFFFYRLGTFIERADSTARVLDVKYHILLPEGERVGGGLDYYQWTALLRSFSASRSYYFLYKDAMKPWLVAEFLILRDEMPRSLIYCLAKADTQLARLANLHGQRRECHRLAGQLLSHLRYATIDDIFQGGLHEFLTDFIRRNNRLSEQIAECYLN